MDYRFHRKVEVQRSRRNDGCIAHLKFTLGASDDEDVVACLVVRQHIPAGLSADELDRICDEHSAVIEPQLRDLAQKRRLFAKRS